MLSGISNTSFQRQAVKILIQVIAGKSFNIYVPTCHIRVMHTVLDPTICKTCGTNYPTPSPQTCAICLDSRQFVPPTGQSWTTPSQFQEEGYRLVFEEIDGYNGNITSVRVEPKFAIGHRAFLIKTPQGNIMWDCLPFLDNEALEKVYRIFEHYYDFSLTVIVSLGLFARSNPSEVSPPSAFLIPTFTVPIQPSLTTSTVPSTLVKPIANGSRTPTAYISSSPLLKPLFRPSQTQP